MAIFNKPQLKRKSPDKIKRALSRRSRQDKPAQQEAFLAKITRPVPHNVYPREKFFNILDKCRKKPVLWLCAPPGSGKTTLISSYIEARKLRPLWYQVDSGDRDLATFFHYMGIAAAKANPNNKEPLPHLTPEYQFGIHEFTHEYFSRLYKRLGKKSLIIFDNYQEVPAGSAFHEMIHEGLAKMPKGANVIFISRTLPPPVLSRMRPSQLMEVLTWDELRLTTDEVKGIASRSGMKIATDEQAHDLLLRTDGWVAGLVLMAECGKTPEFFNSSVDRHDSDAVFSYFAGVLFQKLDGETRDFLLKSSVLPTMTLDMARELTGNRQASQIIAELTRKNYFIQSHITEQIRYQYHPLFREFLQDRLSKGLKDGELAAIELKAAKILAANGLFDSAVKLFKKAGDWDSLSGLISEQAPAMLRQGRHRTLEDWLEGLPAEVADKTPWLLYWKGSCRLPFDQPGSRFFFEKAYEAFHGKKDPYGIFLSWSGVIEATVHEFDNLRTLDPWIGSLPGLLAEYPSFPSKEIEGRVTLCMFMALSFRAPGHPDIGLWADKTYALIEKIPDPDIQAQISLYLVDYFIWIGEIEKADVIVERLSKAARHNSYSPMALIAVRLAEALNGWYHGDLGACISAVSEGLATAETKGIKVFNYFLYGHGAVGSLTCGDLRAADEYLKKAASVMDDNKRLCASYYHHICACYRFANKDLSGALEHESLALGLAVKAGSPFGEAMSRSGMALLHYELGDRQKAAEEVEKAHQLALETKSRLIEFICYLFEAYFALGGGRRDEGVQKLRDAMRLGSRKGFVNFHMWRPDIMTRLCVTALEEDIEAEYVKRLIRERGLFPDDPPLDLSNWPWRLKISTLGQFNVVKDGVPLQFNKKTPGKPIDVLRLLISLGGKDVPEDKITDSLWKDAEGDAAHVAFTTTLHRLRQLIGIDDAIVLRNGCLTINQRYCWVDVFAFDRLINRAEASSDGASAGLLERAIGMYGAGLNINIEEDQWALHFHERVKSKFIRAVVRLGSYLEKAGEFERATECYKKGIETEFLSEELYQKLMMCLYRHGQKAEALIAYNRLKKALADCLGIEPSAKTKQIYKSLR